MKRFGRIGLGSTLVAAGAAMLVLPGPGLLTMFAGVSVLASEFAWASGVAEWAREKTALLGGRSSESVSDET